MAVLYADMVGYSRLIGLDDTGTLERLRALRRDLIDPAIGEHGGRIVQTGGDSLLVTFDSIDGAVRCAVRVQQQIPMHDGEQHADRAIRFRIGINIGDAIADGTDLHGDAVNVAARLQAECPPGGVCVTRSVRDHVHGRLDLSFEPLGALELKNISRPVEAFLVKSGEPTRAGSVKGADIPQPDKPSIAVLPFQNMSGDPEQEYFADGIVEEIITGLSRIPSLHVIARNSSFAYRGKSPDVRKVGEDLGVRYILEGSVRKTGSRVRIIGQLIDATSGAHLWANRFEGELTDIFQLQDRVTVSVVGTVEPQIRAAEIERALRKPTENLEAYDLVLRGRWTYHHATKESFEESARLCRRAIAIDPNYASAYAYLVRTLYALAAQHWTEPSEAEIAEYVDLARTAVRLGLADLDALRLAAHTIALAGGALSEGIAIIDRALIHNPNSAELLAMSGNLRAYAGDTETAFRHLNEADRLNPPGVMVDLKWLGFILASFVDGDYAGVVHWTEQSLQAYPASVVSLRYRAAAFALLGRIHDARQVVSQIHALNPNLTITQVRRFVEVAMKSAFKRPGVVEAYYEGLRLAGLPE